MRELVDADSASLPTASTGGDALQQSENVSRDSRACVSKVGTVDKLLSFTGRARDDLDGAGDLSLRFR